MKKTVSLFLALSLLAALGACGAPAAEPSPSALPSTPIPTLAPLFSSEMDEAGIPDEESLALAAQTASQEADREFSAAGEEEMFTDRDADSSYQDPTVLELSTGNIGLDTDAVRQANTVVIDKEGCYLLTGSLQNGQILIDAPETDKIQLVLAGVDILCQGSAAIYVRQADKVFITLAEGTENRLSSTGDFVRTDENNVDAAVFAKPDLSFNGEGSLTVSCETGHGIVSKDDLKFCSGSYSVTAAGKGLDGKDSIRIAGGNLSVTAGADGLQSDHEDAEKGFIYMSGGSLSVQSAGDGLQSSGGMTFLDGSVTVCSGGGHSSAPAKVQGFGGRGGMNRWSEEMTAETETDPEAITSFKGIKSSTAIVISGGSFLLDCADDAIHSNTDLRVSGGSFEITSGDDALHADAALDLSGGSFTVRTCYEGLEGTDITISGGSYYIFSQDDAVNAAGGNDASGLADFGGMGRGFGAGSGSLSISGGLLYLNTEGDSLDTNGTMTITGGEIYISGPSTSMNGILDSNGGIPIYGGTVVAAGSPGMQQNFSTASTQGSLLLNLSSYQSAGSTVSLYDAEGRLLAQYSPEKAYSLVIVSVPELAVGESYTLTAGTETQTITLSSLIYANGGGFGGGRGGGRR